MANNAHNLLKIRAFSWICFYMNNFVRVILLELL